MPFAVVTVKRFQYRANTVEEYSNRYVFTGSPPTTSSLWRAFFDALCAEERKVYGSGVSIIRGYGYTTASPTAVAAWTVDLLQSPNTPLAGQLTLTGTQQAPGDSAVWVRWGLDKFNTKGKRVYLRKYFHPAHFATGAVDAIAPAQVTALGLFGAKMSDGSFQSGTRVTDAVGTALVGYGTATYITTRTLKRRGKRP